MSDTIDQVVDELRERFFNTRIGDMPLVRNAFPSDQKFIEAFHHAGLGKSAEGLTLALIRYALFQETGMRS